MRKRIAIALLIVSVIGVTVFFVLQPKNGSVEYHRRRYIDAYQGWVWDQELANRVRKIAGRPTRWQTATNRMNYHEQALIRLRYLDERTVIVSNVPPEKVRGAVYKARNQSELLRVEIRETNKVRIVATTQDLPRLEKVARMADVPESGKQEIRTPKVNVP